MPHGLFLVKTTAAQPQPTMKSTECPKLPMVCLYVLLALVGSVSSSKCTCREGVFYCTSQGLTYIPSNVTCRDGVYDESGFAKGPRNYLSIQHFRSIILKQNRINLRGSNVFRRKSSVQFLDLSENKLDSLGSRVFEGLTQLTLLNLTNNGIRALQSDTFSNLLSLHELFLCGNHISSLPPQAFLPLVNLTFLRLDGNSIISLSYGMFAALHRLRKLNLASNQLEGIEKHNFEGLVSLEQLNLSRNNIRRIDHELTQRIECQVETLSSCGDNEHCFDYMTNLKEIDLTNNSLTTLNAETFLCSPNLSKLHLSGNPFRCKNCRMKKVNKQVCESKGICSDELTCRNKRKNQSSKSSNLQPNKKGKKKNRERKEKKQRRGRNRIINRRDESFYKSSTSRPTTTTTTMTKTTKSSNVEIFKTTTESPTSTTEESQTTLLLPTTTSLSGLPTEQVITSSKIKQLQTNHGDVNAEGSIRKIPATSGDLEIVLWLIVSSVIAGISAILVCITLIAFCSRYNRSLEEIKNIPPQTHCELKRESLSSLSYNPLALRPLPEEPKTDVESVIDGASICGDDALSNEPPVYNRDKVHLKWITRGTFSLGKFNRHESANFEQNIDIPTFPALPSRNDTRRSSNNSTSRHHHAPLRKVESSDDNRGGRRVK